MLQVTTAPKSWNWPPKKYAECAADVHSTQAAKNCANLVAMVYCKKLEASSAAQDKKVSLK